MKKQPNFEKLFFKNYGGKPRKVKYKIRRNSNRFHDLVFLNSMIHDSCIRRKDFSLRGECLRIEIERECRELGLVEYKNGRAEYHHARAEIKVSPVQRVEWRFTHGIKFSPKTVLWLQKIWIDRRATQADGSVPIHLFGFDWECILTVNLFDLKVRLEDQEVPYLASKRKKG